MKPITLVLILLSILAIRSAAQTPQESLDFIRPELINTPSILIPPDAERTGLGGIVRVRIAIDESGFPTGVEAVSGPGWVCQQISRPDVDAMRDAASKAAMMARFKPATLKGLPRTSAITLNFDFPGSDPVQPKVINAGAATSTGRTKDSKWGDPDLTGKTAKQERYTALGAKPAETAVVAPPIDEQGPVIAVRGTGVKPSAAAPANVSGGVMNGKAIKLFKPPYPPAARAVGASGAVSVQVLIDTNGEIFTSQALSGHPLLRASSAAAACQSKFEPVTLSGQPVRVTGIITYNFVP